MRVAGSSFVHLDNDEACREGGCAEDVEQEVGECASALLAWGVCGLEDEGGLNGEEETGGVEQLFAISLVVKFF
jgi:hypothetical protein